MLDYLLEMKKSGVVRHIGLSSHTPELIQKILDTGLVEQLMFSINPAYDYQHGEFAIGSASERMKLYQRCEAEGIGISVMKPYSAGQLLSDQASPFGKALTKVQCLQYALDKPGVLTVLPGIRNLEDIKEALSWLDASPEERDYSVPGDLHPQGRHRHLRVLQPLRPLPGGAEHRPYQQVLRSGKDRRRHGGRTTMESWKSMPPTASPAATATAAALPCGPVGSDESHCGILWTVAFIKNMFRPARSCLKIGNVPGGEGFFRQTRQFDAAILGGLQGKLTQHTGEKTAVWAC